MYRIIGADGREYGPISAEQLRQWIAEGRAIATTRVLREGASEWTTLGGLPEFSLLIGGAAAQTTAVRGAPVIVIAGRRNNGFAVTGLVLGIFSITFGFCCCNGIPFNFLGLVFSIIALSQISREPQRYGGKGIAIAGLVLSLLSLLLALLLMLLGAGGGWHPMRHHVYRL